MKKFLRFMKLWLWIVGFIAGILAFGAIVVYSAEILYRSFGDFGIFAFIFLVVTFIITGFVYEETK